MVWFGVVQGRISRVTSGRGAETPPAGDGPGDRGRKMSVVIFAEAERLASSLFSVQFYFSKRCQSEIRVK